MIILAKEIPVGCAKPVSSSIGKGEDKEEKILNQEKKEEKNMIMVGSAAPDFTAPAYQKGKFINVKLSDYKGKWVVLCFYPGDFTFV